MVISHKSLKALSQHCFEFTTTPIVSCQDFATSSTNASFGAKTDVAKYFEYCLFFSMEEVIASPRLIGGDFPIVALEDKGSKRSRRSRPYYTELP